MGFDLDSTFVSDMGFDCEQLERKYPNMGSSYEVKNSQQDNYGDLKGPLTGI